MNNRREIDRKNITNKRLNKFPSLPILTNTNINIYTIHLTWWIHTYIPYNVHTHMRDIWK